MDLSTSPHARRHVGAAALLDRRRIDAAEQRVDFAIGTDWAQGRTTYGGLIAMLAVQAMRDLAGADWPLRALQTSFVGPVGGELSVQVRLLRQGRHVRQVLAEVHSQGACAAMLMAVFGNGRPSRVPPLVARRPAPAHEPQALHSIDPPPGVGPGFLAHLETRWSEGDLPYTGGDRWESSIHLRLRDAAAAAGLDAELLTVLLADMPPTPAAGHLHAPAPSSSVSWELELWPFAPAGADGWWRADTEVLAADAGYASQRTTLWSPGGEVAGFGYQLVAVFG